jgi:hypothetical protein
LTKSADSLGLPAEDFEVAEHEIDADSPGDGAERKVVAREPHGDQPEAERDQAGAGEARGEPEPGRAAVERGEHAGRVGPDADESLLAERHEPGDAGEQHQPQRDQRRQADVVHQRHVELRQRERRTE